jgi:hypothetical protein
MEDEGGRWKTWSTAGVRGTAGGWQLHKVWVILSSGDDYASVNFEQPTEAESGRATVLGNLGNAKAGESSEEAFSSIQYICDQSLGEFGRIAPRGRKW